MSLLVRMKYNFIVKHDYLKLLETGQYATILTSTSDLDVGLALVARVIAYHDTGDDEHALSLIETRHEELKNYLALIVPVHFAILKTTDDIASGYRWLRIYQELPYASIEVEEALHEFQTFLETDQRQKETTIAEYTKSLISGDINAKFSALAKLPTESIASLLPHLEPLLVEPYPPIMHYAALKRLIEAKIDSEVNYESNGLIYQLVPSMMDEPLTCGDALDFLELLQTSRADPSAKELARDLLMQYALAIYPLDPPYEDDNHLLNALLTMVDKYLGHHIDTIDEVSKQIIDDIESAIKRYMVP